MKGVEVSKTSLAISAAKLKAEDIRLMPVKILALSVHEVKRRMEAFEDALKRCSTKPEILVKKKKRVKFMEFARLELEAGAKLLELFAADPRYDRMLDIEKLAAQGEVPGARSWDDFIQFWELEDEELEYIKAQIHLEE